MTLSPHYMQCLEDATGQPAFAKAIARFVRKGDVVLDVGTGSGIHSLLACRAGAARVYAVEREDVIELARRVCASNGCDGRMHFLHGSVFEIELPERVDVAICNMGLRDLARVMPFCAASFLKPSGRLIPERADVLCAPVESESAAAGVAFWGRRPFGFDFSAFQSVTANTGLDHRLQDRELLASPALVASLDLACDRSEAMAELDFEIHRDGCMHGVGVWHVQHFGDNISATLGPPSCLSEVWRNLFLPLESPIALKKHDRVSIWLETGPGGWGTHWNWRLTVRNAAGEARTQTAQSTLFGELYSKRALARAAPGFVPQLSPSGKAAQFVLTGCMSGLGVGEMRDKLCELFPRLFPRREEAAAFIAEIVEKYAP